VNVWQGRLSLDGYRVELREDGFLTRLEIETPAGTLYRGPEPGQWLTRKGALYLMAGPPIVAALLIAAGLVAPGLPPLLPVFLLLAGALAVGIGIRLHWQSAAPLRDRAFDYAWTRLASWLHTGGFVPADAAFASGLALASIDRGDPALRARVLGRLVSLLEKTVAAGAGSLEYLADLRRLEIADAAAAGEDPWPRLVAQVGRCFVGRLPLVYAERVLRGWEDAWWTRFGRERLRILLLQRAFETRFEVRHLIEAGRIAPALGSLLRTDQRDSLAHLRLLWSWRGRRPWSACGTSETVFDLAAGPAGNPQLVRYPDLLLVQEIALPRAAGATDREKAVLVISVGGIVFRDQVFPEAPRRVEVSVKRQNDTRGYELEIGQERFWFRSNPDFIAARLERWFRFYFGEFLPQVPAVHGWRSPEVAARLQASETVPCPRCARPFLARAGQVGVTPDQE
jgi:hypothetical protein